MIDFILAISALAICITFYQLIRNTGRLKRVALYSFFTLVFAGGAITGCSSTNEPTDQGAINQSNLGQESTQSETGPSNSKQPSSSSAVSGTIKVHFIDVGQADAILIQLPSGQNMLIDAGNNDDDNLVVNYLKSNNVKKLDHVVGTHPHEDHIGGLDAAITSFAVGKVYLPKVSHNTKTYGDLLLAIKNKGLKVTEARSGVKPDVGQETTAEFLAPNGSSYDDLNNYSAVLKLSYGNLSFLFTGDAEEVSESQMIEAGHNLKADVLKVGHHGSSSSTTADFLKSVSPKYAVICVGKDNDYGHPHAETLSKLSAAGVEVFRTDQLGPIIATSDGKTVTFNTKPPGSAKPAASTPASTGSATSIVIASIDLGAEVVTIKNNNGVSVNISGWKLVSEKGNQEFVFPTGTTVAAGETIQVTAGPNATAGSGVLVWTMQYIWNNDVDPGSLYDAGGKLISRYPR